MRHSCGFVIVANPDSRRVALFQESLARLGQKSARVVAYVDLLAGRTHLSEVVRRGDVVRIESPGRDWEVERSLLCAGVDAAFSEDVQEGGSEWMSRGALQELHFERGRVLPSRQWYLGWCQVLQLIECQLTECPPHRLMNCPADITLMFDKPRCHELLARSGVATPRSLGSPACFDDLVTRMKEVNCRRVFIKLAHGSSASGIVAYRTDGERHQAATTIEPVRRGNELLLFNTRRIRVHQDVAAIAETVDALCRHRVHVEEWLPKAGFAGRTFDLRVVVINGRAQHTVVRLSRSPMTNLHLLNERGDVAALRARIQSQLWESAMQTCEAAMTCFPGSLYSGVDLLFTPNFKKHAVLEVNAFGDLLPGVLCDGLDTYSAQVRAVIESSG